MSYQVLARKWRPHQFKDVVGQSHVLTALSNALDHNRLHHAYLFSGTRGVGKTTIARIFAKALNCEQGISASPCGVCSTCQEIDQGRYVDLLEIDAASRTKVEDTRELLDNVQYKPARGRFKVYLIDEVHMLSRNSFNALLKTLEEPPEYVKFLLATTDPQKLPVTILSRCLQFHLKHLDAEQIKNQLAHVLEQESLPFEPRALSFIARAAEGSMRDALSLTDQAIALGNGAVNDAHVLEMLGTLSTDQAILLLEALSQADADPVMQCVSVLAEKGIEWDGLLKELAAQTHHIAMAQALPEAIDTSLPDAERILKLSRQFTPQDIQLYYQILLQGRQDLPYAPDGRAGLEMVLLRMLAFKPVTSNSYTPERINIPVNEPIRENTSGSAPSPKKDLVAELQALRSHLSTPPIKKPLAPEHSVKAVQTKAPEIVKEMPIAQEKIVNAHQSVSEKNTLMPAQSLAPTFSPVLTEDVSATENVPEYPKEAIAITQQDEPTSNPTSQLVSPPQQQSSNMALLQARSLLRSHSKIIAQENAGLKKKPITPNNVSSSSAIERVSQKYKPAPRHLVENTNQPLDEKKEDAYRWTSTQEPRDKTVDALSPKLMKKALEHEKTPEMKKRIEQGSIEQDAWSRIACSLSITKRAKMLVLDSIMHQNENKVFLGVREKQKHLISDTITLELTHALKPYLGENIHLTVEISQEGITPLEWRDKLYEEKLMKANQSLKDDPNVIFFCQRFMAKIDEDSIRPL